MRDNTDHVLDDALAIARRIKDDEQESPDAKELAASLLKMDEWITNEDGRVPSRWSARLS